jgi:hypothetical protein
MGATLGDHDAVHASASPQLSFSAASANQAILFVETEKTESFRCASANGACGVTCTSRNAVDGLLKDWRSTWASKYEEITLEYGVECVDAR